MCSERYVTQTRHLARIIATCLVLPAIWLACIPIWHHMYLHGNLWFTLRVDQPTWVSLSGHLACHVNLFHLVSNIIAWIAVAGCWWTARKRWLMAMVPIAMLAAFIHAYWLTVFDRPMVIIGGSGLIYAYLGLICGDRQPHYVQSARWLIITRWVIIACLIVQHAWYLWSDTWYGSGMSHVLALSCGYLAARIVSQLFSSFTKANEQKPTVDK